MTIKADNRLLYAEVTDQIIIVPKLIFIINFLVSASIGILIRANPCQRFLYDHDLHR
jgi:hypothetical protein